jgi:hypothetical protein
MYADMVVLNARSQVHSSDHMRQLCETSDSHAFRRWQRERWRRDATWFLARARSVRLWIFAPRQDVSVFSRVSRLLRFVGLLPCFLMARFLTSTGPISRWLDRGRAKVHAWSQEEYSDPEDKKGKYNPSRTRLGPMDLCRACLALLHSDECFSDFIPLGPRVAAIKL